MSEIKTLVYFDIEATGLKNSGRPRITELSLVAVSTRDVLDLQSNLMNCTESQIEAEKILPRIINKLTICAYPMAIIRPEVSEITGLDNYNLSGQASFNIQTGELLNCFLAHLPGPICLVAHNGDQYDFPLLKAELKKIGTSLPSDTLCADSYPGLKEIFRERERMKPSPGEYYETNTDSVKVKGVAEMNGIQNLKTNLDEEYKELEVQNLKTPTKKLSSKRQNCEDRKVQNIETTPTAKITRMNAIRKRTQLQYTGMTRAKKKLDFRNRENPKSYSLINLHRHVLGYSPSQSHGAEPDCIALLRTTAVLGMDWVQWVQDNCHLFSQCTEMWSYKK